MNFLDLGSPIDRQRAVMEKALEERRRNWSRGNMLYSGGGDLLLRHGKFYSGRVLPDQYAHHKGGPGQCFMNALTACQQDSALRYVEGVYTIGQGTYTPHAWCLDPAGELLEVTLNTAPEDIARGVEAATGLPMLGVEHWGYWGAVFHPEYVQAVFDAQNGVGLLDRPVHDMLTAGPQSSVEEWRDDWPVLRQPYDPDRRAP